MRFAIITGYYDKNGKQKFHDSILQEALYSNIINEDKQDDYFLKVDFIKKEQEFFIHARDNGSPKEEEKSAKKNNGLPEGSWYILTLRIDVINSSALQPILLNYCRKKMKTW